MTKPIIFSALDQQVRHVLPSAEDRKWVDIRRREGM